MHIKIAWEIYQKQKQKRGDSKHLSNSTDKLSSAKSSSSKSNKNSSSRPSNNEQSSTPSNHSLKSSSNIMKNSFDSMNGQSSALRSSSATTFSSSYPPRYGTPLSASSMSAPPMLPGLFPTSMPSPLQLPGLMPDNWPRPLLPGSLPGPLTSNRGPFSFPDYYASVNSASSALSAWAANIKPPSDSNNHNGSTGKTHEKSSSSGHKRKHESYESSKERASSSSKHSSYQNGDIRSEPSNKKIHSSSSKHNKSDASSGRSVYENGDNYRTRTSDHSDALSHNKPLSELKHDTRNSFSNTSSSLTPPMFASHSTFTSNEHQRYIDLLGGMPPLGSYPQPNPYISSRSNPDLSSRPLWPFGMPPPPLPSTSTSSSTGCAPAPPSAMMPDPFKSLQDISLRPGLVTPDRENLFSRYSLLNSSGGGASIFDKLNKEQLEKYEMLQNHNKTNSSNPKPDSLMSSSSSSSTSRSSNTNHLSMSTTSITPPSAHFSYPSPYLNPLHPFGPPPPPGASYLQQPIGQPYPNAPSLMNGSDAISKMSLSHHFPGVMANDPQFMLPSAYQTRPPSPRTVNFMKAATATSATFGNTR